MKFKNKKKCVENIYYSLSMELKEFKLNWKIEKYTFKVFIFLSKNSLFVNIIMTKHKI